MSYWRTNIWRATVITNLLSAIPNISTSLIKWTWGNFSVDKVNLTHFFTFHFILLFIIAALAAVHLLFLYKTGSNNPTGISSHIDKIPFHPYHTIKGASLVAQLVKNLPANAGDVEDPGSIPGSGWSPGEGNGNPFQNSCLENPMDRGVWQATVHEVAKSRTWLKRLSVHTCMRSKTS